jgi:biotin operon repressor
MDGSVKYGDVFRVFIARAEHLAGRQLAETVGLFRQAVAKAP